MQTTNNEHKVGPVQLIKARFKLKKEVLSSLYNLTLPGLNEERHHIVAREPGRQILDGDTGQVPGAPALFIYKVSIRAVKN